MCAVVSLSARMLQFASQQFLEWLENEQEEFIKDARQAVNKTVQEYNWDDRGLSNEAIFFDSNEEIFQEILFVALETERVQRTVEEVMDDERRVHSREKLQDELESSIEMIIDPSLELNVEELAENFAMNLHQEIVDHPHAWGEIMNRYGEEVSQNMPEYQKEIHRSLFDEIDSLRMERHELQKKANRQFMISVVLGGLNIVLAIFSAYLSYITFF